MSKRNRKKMSDYDFNVINVEVFILGILGVILIFGIMTDQTLYESYPSLIRDSPQIIILLVIGMAYYVLTRIYEVGKFQIPSFRVEIRNPEIIKVTTKVLVWMAMTQILGLLLTQKFTFNVTAVQVYAFFATAAIMEEYIFRIGIGEFMFKTSQNILKGVPETVIIIIVSIINGIIFAAFHTRYYSQPINMLVVGIGGFSLCYFLLKYKMELPVFIAHILTNIAVAGTIIQNLGVV